jgi:hypothetical protein
MSSSGAACAGGVCPGGACPGGVCANTGADADEAARTRAGTNQRECMAGTKAPRVPRAQGRAAVAWRAAPVGGAYSAASRFVTTAVTFRRYT